jgi:hypothetical protein
MKRTLLMATLGAFLAVGAISGTVGAQAPAKVEQDAAAKPATKKKATPHHAAAKADQTGPNAKSDLQVKAQPTGPEPSSPARWWQAMQSSVACGVSSPADQRGSIQWKAEIDPRPGRSERFERN